MKPKFPLLQLPLELRQQILSYLLPHTQEFRDSGLLSEHARNFSAVKKRGARGMMIPSGGASAAGNGVSNVVWQRGQISLFCVSKQLCEECTELVYGSNTFLLFVAYSGVTFRFRWLLPSGLAPSRSFNFLDLLPTKYMHRVKKVIVHVDHVDSYTGWIKFNVGGDRLTRGLQSQVRKLVDALRTTGDAAEGSTERHLSRLNIRVSNGNAVLDSLKSDVVRQREGGIKVAEDIEEMLEPFNDLRGMHEVSVTGAVTEKFARALEERMKTRCDREALETEERMKKEQMDDWLAPAMKPRLCVYGNDML